MRRLPKKLFVAFIAAAVAALAVVGPAFAGVNHNHNETFLRD
jgi:hypothetical protein